MVDLNVMADKIKTTLQTVSGIKQAYDYEPQNMSQLPAATLYFDGFSQSEKTTRRSSINWQWTVRIYVPINTSDIKVPQQEIRNLIYDSIKQLRSDLSLGGTCLFNTVSSGEVFAMLEQTNPLMVAELTLVATTED
ncbi:hypothetical protein [Bacillus sp. 03113]|uniref:hypothetical protein n=1 Tax=Bacillus sp. 03113 TaxID=2578211 RepID=UPI0011412B29|nr:hypothetical protein [Bacillus sp. 03113]